MQTTCDRGSTEAHPIGAIRYAAGMAIDDLMQDVTDDLAASGVRLGGLIQHASTDGGDCCAVMRLRDLRNGSLVSISQDLGSGTSACRLDSAALADVATRLEAALEEDLDMLVLNRFGRAEAEGQGLRATIQKAVSAGIPVLLAVRDEHAEAWENFHGGLGTALPADRAAILSWCHRTVQKCGCA